MRNKLLTIIVLLFACFTLSAQTDVTKFLGIPVDGTKSEMISKLTKKGFVWDKDLEQLTGEFNGTDVIVDVVTNKNKVYRVVVFDAYPTDETAIKIRFNTLCSQFEKNNKYVSLLSDGFYNIPDREDISDSILLNNKRYEAAYYQAPEKWDTASVKNELNKIILSQYPNWTQNNIDNLPDSIQSKVAMQVLPYLYETLSKKTVWFMISEQYGRYRIAMYYDNVYNQANGDDL